MGGGGQQELTCAASPTKKPHLIHDSHNGGTACRKRKWMSCTNNLVSKQATLMG